MKIYLLTTFIGLFTLHVFGQTKVTKKDQRKSAMLAFEASVNPDTVAQIKGYSKAISMDPTNDLSSPIKVWTQS